MNGQSGGHGLAVVVTGYILLTLAVYPFLSGLSFRIDGDILVRSALVSLVITAVWRLLLNRWLWRVQALRILLGVRTPYVHGRWGGYLKSSYDNFQKRFPIVIEIQQTYKHTHLTYYDQRAVSRGVITEFILEEGGSPKLLCVYRNEPTVASVKELQIHYGTMILTVASGNTRIKGIYFNYYLQRGTYGELFLKFQGRELKRTFEAEK